MRRRLLTTVAARARAAEGALGGRSPLTKIVATIGPASEEATPLARCVAAGLDVMRVNFSHATKARTRSARALVGIDKAFNLVHIHSPVSTAAATPHPLILVQDEFHLRRRNLRAAPGGQRAAVMLDTKGPEIRMGGLAVCKESGNRKAKVRAPRAVAHRVWPPARPPQPCPPRPRAPALDGPCPYRCHVSCLYRCA